MLYMIILVLLTKYLHIGSFMTFKVLKSKTPIKFLNSLNKDQITLECFKNNQTIFLDQLKLENEKRTLNLENLKLENEERARNVTLNLEILKLENEKRALNLKYLKLENEKRALNFELFLNLVLTVYATFTMLQVGIYIRDGLIGKISGENAFKTIASKVYSKFNQIANVIFKWAVSLLKIMRLNVS